MHSVVFGGFIGCPWSFSLDSSSNSETFLMARTRYMEAQGIKLKRLLGTEAT